MQRQAEPLTVHVVELRQVPYLAWRDDVAPIRAFEVRVPAGRDGRGVLLGHVGEHAAHAEYVTITGEAGVAPSRVQAVAVLVAAAGVDR